MEKLISDPATKPYLQTRIELNQSERFSDCIATP